MKCCLQKNGRTDRVVSLEETSSTTSFTDLTVDFEDRASNDISNIPNQIRQQTAIGCSSRDSNPQSGLPRLDSEWSYIKILDTVSSHIISSMKQVS